MTIAAISLNGQNTDVLNGLYEGAKPGFDNFLGKTMEFGQALTPDSLATMLEKFNTTIEALSLAKNVFEGDIPDVMHNLSGLAETFFDNVSEAESQAADMAEQVDDAPTLSPKP